MYNELLLAEAKYKYKKGYKISNANLLNYRCEFTLRDYTYGFYFDGNDLLINTGKSRFTVYRDGKWAEVLSRNCINLYVGVKVKNYENNTL